MSGNWPTRLTLIGVSRKQIEMKQKEKEVKQIETNVDKLMMFIELLIKLSNRLAKFNALMQTICPKRVSMGFLRCRYRLEAIRAENLQRNINLMKELYEESY